MLIVVCYGGGTNSTALLVEMIKRGEPAPHAILFADTGGEKPHTYAYIEMLSTWLTIFSYPPITVVRRNSRGKGTENLYDSCFRLNVLPSVAYGWRTRSQKYKIEPQDKWFKGDNACKDEWLLGGKVSKVIGFDWGEVKRARFGEDEKYILRYPLIDWRMDRAACVKAIEDAGLELPGKSACFFCPHSKKGEIRQLSVQYPELLQKALALEANAKNLKKTKGLGRNFAWSQLDACATPDDPFDEIPCGCYDG